MVRYRNDHTKIDLTPGERMCLKEQGKNDHRFLCEVDGERREERCTRSLSSDHFPTSHKTKRHPREKEIGVLFKVQPDREGGERERENLMGRCTDTQDYSFIRGEEYRKESSAHLHLEVRGNIWTKESIWGLSCMSHTHTHIHTYIHTYIHTFKMQ